MLLIFLFAILHPARALGPVPGIPNLFYDNPTMTLNQLVLGQACYSIHSSILDLDCNPAFMAGEQRQMFRVNVVGNDKVGTVNSYRERLGDGGAPELIADLSSERDPVIAKAAASVWYQYENWAFGVVPIRAGYAALSRNMALPDISANVYKDLEVFGQAGWFVTDDRRFRFGLKTRYIHRDYVYQNFLLTDAIANPALVGIRRLDVVYVDPSIAYTWDSSWEPTLSAAVTYLPLFQTGATLPFRPSYEIGLSSKFIVFDHAYVSTTHFTGRPDTQDFFQRFSYSGMFEWAPHFNFTFTLGKNLFAVGVRGNLDSVILGIGYKTEQVSPDAWHSAQISSTMFEAGLVF